GGRGGGTVGGRGSEARLFPTSSGRAPRESEVARPDARATHGRSERGCLRGVMVVVTGRTRAVRGRIRGWRCRRPSDEPAPIVVGSCASRKVRAGSRPEVRCTL